MIGKTATEIESWLRDELARALEIQAPEVDVEAPLTEIGLDSVALLEITGALEEWLGFELSPSTLTQHRTIRALSTHLAKR
jgi:acyl carrier protein